METVFDHNPTEQELSRFGIKKEFGNIDKQIEFMRELNKKSNDDNLYQLGLLFSIRGNIERANQYFSKIKNKKMLDTLIQDF